MCLILVQSIFITLTYKETVVQKIYAPLISIQGWIPMSPYAINSTASIKLVVWLENQNSIPEIFVSSEEPLIWDSHQ